MFTWFVRDVCGSYGLWRPQAIIENCIASVRAQVEDRSVVLALSGGVGSSVVVALLGCAIGTQLHCIFVDNGLLREGEGD